MNRTHTAEDSKSHQPQSAAAGLVATKNQKRKMLAQHMDFNKSKLPVSMSVVSKCVTVRACAPCLLLCGREERRASSSVGSSRGRCASVCVSRSWISCSSVRGVAPPSLRLVRFRLPGSACAGCWLLCSTLLGSAWLCLLPAAGRQQDWLSHPTPLMLRCSLPLSAQNSSVRWTRQPVDSSPPPGHRTDCAATGAGKAGTDQRRDSAGDPPWMLQKSGAVVAGLLSRADTGRMHRRETKAEI
jgi:hypothetical protein